MCLFSPTSSLPSQAKEKAAVFSILLGCIPLKHYNCTYSLASLVYLDFSGAVLSNGDGRAMSRATAGCWADLEQKGVCLEKTPCPWLSSHSPSCHVLGVAMVFLMVASKSSDLSVTLLCRI